MEYQHDNILSNAGMAGIMSTTEQYSMIEVSQHLLISDHLGQEQVTPLASIPTAASAAPKLAHNQQQAKKQQENCPHQVPKKTNKRLFPGTGGPEFESPKRAAYTCDLIWPTESNLGSSDFGNRLQRMIGETMVIMQQGMHRLTAQVEVLPLKSHS